LKYNEYYPNGYLKYLKNNTWQICDSVVYYI
jgi:hypothetical protein